MSVQFKLVVACCVLFFGAACSGGTGGGTGGGSGGSGGGTAGGAGGGTAGGAGGGTAGGAGGGTAGGAGGGTAGGAGGGTAGGAGGGTAGGAGGGTAGGAGGGTAGGAGGGTAGGAGGGTAGGAGGGTAGGAGGGTAGGAGGGTAGGAGGGTAGGAGGGTAGGAGGGTAGGAGGGTAGGAGGGTAGGAGGGTAGGAGGGTAGGAGGGTAGGAGGGTANVCGDGTRGGTEACDDNNLANNDGCSATCTVETGYLCTGTAPSVCAGICGDGLKVASEGCDDSNSTNSDGCSSVCAIEPGYACYGAPSTCTAVIDETEPNDDGTLATNPSNTSLGDFLASAANGPYSSSVVLRGAIGVVGDDDVFKFVNTSTVAKTFQFDVYNGALGFVPCGTSIDTYLNIRDAAGSATPLVSNDDRAASADRCSTASWVVPAGETVYAQLIDFSDNGVIPSWLLRVKIPLCGNLIVEAGEECDLANATICDPTTCQRVAVCGDTFRDAPEACDDGNVAAADGCSATCAVEPGYSCTTATPNVCTLLPACGNGILQGTEQCDDSNLTANDGCSATCTIEPGFVCTGSPSVCSTVCGDGIKTSTEGCDDANLAVGDGCSATCTVETGYVCPGSPSVCVATIAEVESNNTCATANGPIAIPSIISASATPAADPDWFTFTLTSYSDVRFETFDATGPGSCSPSSIDTVIEILRSDCTTVQSATKDQGGIGNCTRVDPGADVGVRHMAPGSYKVRVAPFSSTATYNYTLQTTLLAQCGNSLKEGSEECDGGATCAADCTLIPVCGDGTRSGTEVCDDGNTTNGDGCSAICAWETTAEVEPNGTITEADTNAVANPQLLINGTRYLTGAITPTLDKDLYKLTVAAPNTVVHLEVFDPSGTDCTAAQIPASLTLRLLNSIGTAITSDTSTAGIGLCPALAYRLDAGTYYVQVEKTTAGTVAGYFLSVTFPASNGSEVEPNDTQATSTASPGRRSQILGDHQVTTDTDWYAITVPQGGSLRAETIEGDATETCESLGIDSTLTLYNAAGTSLGSNGDTGRGYCSLIDGTGASAANSYARNLAAGTYYLRVTSFGTTGGNNQFNYRLVVIIR